MAALSVPWSEKTNTPPSDSLCLFGAGGHGLCLAAQIGQRLGLSVVFADGQAPIGRDVGGYPVAYAQLSDIPRDLPLLISIGASAARRALQEQADVLGLHLARFVADPQNCFAAEIGAGTVVFAGAVVNAGAILGQGVIVNSSAVVEHGCKIGNFSHIAPGAVVAGDATIGSECWIGANATVLQGLAICDKVFIGAGAVVTRNIDVPGNYVGAPARLISGPPRP